MTLLVLATAMLFSVGFLKGVEGRKLLQEEETFPSEDILEEQDLTGGEYAMAMAPRRHRTYNDDDGGRIDRC